MSAGTKTSIIPPIKRLGIVAGGGIIPKQLAEFCLQQNIMPVVVGIKGQTDSLAPDQWGRIGTSGKTIKFFQSQNIHDLVLIGSVKRPSLIDLWPDWFTFKFFLKAWVKSFGDNSLLEAAREELETQGFKIHGVHKFLPDMLMPEGILSTAKLEVPHLNDVELGIQESQKLGAADRGQAVIVKNGNIIAREDKRGTSAMIKRYGCAEAILVKTCKPQQDRDLDLPTIGPNTAKLCAEKGMAGIVGQAGATLMVERDAVVKVADEHNFFVMGVTIDATN